MTMTKCRTRAGGYLYRFTYAPAPLCYEPRLAGHTFTVEIERIDATVAVCRGPLGELTVPLARTMRECPARWSCAWNAHLSAKRAWLS